MKLSAGLLLTVTLLQKTDGTIFGIRIRDAPQQQYRPQYKPQYKPNIFDGVAGLKAGALRSGANALRFKGDVFHNGANILDNTANGFSPSQELRNQALQQRPSPQTSSAQLNFLNAFGNNLQNSYNSPSYKPPSNNNDFNSVISNNNNNNEDPDVITINNQGPFTSGRDPDVIVGDPRAVDPGLLRQAQQIMLEKQKMNALRTELMRVKDASTGPKIRQCEERFTQLVGDIFIGNEMVPDVIETPPKYPLELTYRMVPTTHWSSPTWTSTPGETGHWQSSGTGSLPISPATLWTMVKLYLIFCSRWCCLRETGITGLVTS